MDGRVRGGLTSVPAHEGRDRPFLPWSLVVHQISSQGQRWRDGLEEMSHQNAWRNTASVALTKPSARLAVQAHFKNAII